MRHDTHLRETLLLALTAGLQLAACDGTGGGDPTPPTGTKPEGLEQICAQPLLATVSLAEPLDFLALRRIGDWGDDSREELWSDGTPCETATDRSTCEDTLAETWPSATGWGYCGEGCSDSGVVSTAGDTVGLYDSPEEIVDLLGTVDTPADALLVATSQQYTPTCESVRLRADGAWRMNATFLVSDCPWTDSVREIEVAEDGTTTMVREISLNETEDCAGRLPRGIHAPHEAPGSAVAQHLARLAWLEGAAVVAFEHLAEELRELGAPTHLVARAREAARDEVRHAARLGALARAAGATVPAVEVAPRTSRSLLDFALHNATEGCVRETFGVVDAAYRGRRAPSARLRAVFAEIAEDEARHAALSWDIARWVEERLTEAERAQVDAARREAHRGLVTALRRGRAGEVEEELGAPGAEVAVRMAEVLWEGLAA